MVMTMMVMMTMMIMMMMVSFFISSSKKFQNFHTKIKIVVQFFLFFFKFKFLYVCMHVWSVSLPNGLYYNDDAGLPEAVFQRKGKVCKDLHRPSR